MEILLGVIIITLVIVVYFFTKPSSDAISKEDHDEILKRQKSEAELESYRDKNKLIFCQFGDYIKSLFKEKNYYAKQEFEDILKHDFPMLYKGSNQEWLLDDLLYSSLIREKIKKVRNKRPIPKNLHPEDYDPYDYYEDVIEGYELGEQYQNVFLIFPNFISFCNNIYDKNITSYNSSLRQNKTHGSSKDVSFRKRINWECELEFGLSIGKKMNHIKDEYEFWPTSFYLFGVQKTSEKQYGGSIACNYSLIFVQEIKSDLPVSGYTEIFNNTLNQLTLKTHNNDYIS